jgi:hypothetical protein
VIEQYVGCIPVAVITYITSIGFNVEFDNCSLMMFEFPLLVAGVIPFTGGLFHEKVAVAFDVIVILKLLPLHICSVKGIVKTGTGGIVILKVTSEPGQLLRTVDTVIVAIMGSPVVLGGAFHGAILPEPDVSSPIAASELTQENEAPEGVLEKEGIDI